MVFLTWIYGQNKFVKFTLPLPWNDLSPGQRLRDMRQGSNKPIQQCKLDEHWMLFWCSGSYNTSLTNVVKKVAVLKYYPHDVVACDENGHVSSLFQAMRLDGYAY